MHKFLHSLIPLLLAFVYSLSADAEIRRNSLYQTYIEQYAPLAQQQMQKYGIPASITLAQGLLESGAGRSFLATRANNHFGIKVTTDWTGPYVCKDDDKRNDKFRSYSSVYESYEDHSRFLKRARYESLFKLSPTDYKGWARGLKACGYATNPVYAQNLIDIIELYDLKQYDSKSGKGGSQAPGNVAVSQPGYVVTTTTQSNSNIADIIHFCNGTRYIIARPGDTWESLGRMYGVRASKLRRRNDYPSGVPVSPGAIVYLDTKASKAAKVYKGKFHKVERGESMHSISQRYGIKMKSLYRINRLNSDYNLQVGDMLLLRR